MFGSCLILAGTLLDIDPKLEERIAAGARGHNDSQGRGKLCTASRVVLVLRDEQST